MVAMSASCQAGRPFPPADPTSSPATAPWWRSRALVCGGQHGRRADDPL